MEYVQKMVFWPFLSLFVMPGWVWMAVDHGFLIVSCGIPFTLSCRT